MSFNPNRPFNGCTGRVLNLLYLVEKGLLDTPVLYLSRRIFQNTAIYLKAMVSEGLLEEVKIRRENLYINPAPTGTAIRTGLDA